MIVMKDNHFFGGIVENPGEQWYSQSSSCIFFSVMMDASYGHIPELGRWRKLLESYCAMIAGLGRSNEVEDV